MNMIMKKHEHDHEKHDHEKHEHDHEKHEHVFVLSAESDKLQKDIIELLKKKHETPDSEKKYVIVQFYVNQIRKINDVEQSVEIDLYLKLNWISEHWIGKTDDDFQNDENRFNKDVWWAPGVEVTNAIELEKQTEEEEAFWLEFPQYGVLAYTQRYMGTVSSFLDLHKFPFDSQIIQITFESFHWKSNDMQLLVLAHHMNQKPPRPGGSWPTMSNDVVLEEWTIEGIKVSENTKHYSFEDRDYSQVKVEVQLVRNYGYYLTKILSILVLIIACSWIVFWLDCSDLSGRTGISVTLFLAAITFTFVIGTNLPRISYHTFIDAYLFTSYIYIVLSIVLNLLIAEVHKYSEESSEYLNNLCKAFFPLTFTIYSIRWFFWCAAQQKKKTPDKRVSGH